MGVDRHLRTVFPRLEHQRRFDIDICTNSNTSAVQHLHSLGRADIDLQPSNIMVDEFVPAIDIDFGSSQPLSNDLIATGSRGWINEEFVTSARLEDTTKLL